MDQHRSGATATHSKRAPAEEGMSVGARAGAEAVIGSSAFANNRH